MKDTHKKDTLGVTCHAGIESARVGWVTYDSMYIGNGKSRTLPSAVAKPSKSKIIFDEFKIIK